MTEYCELCGCKLDPDEEEDGICEDCKNQDEEEDEEEYKKDEDYIDPAIT